MLTPDEVEAAFVGGSVVEDHAWDETPRYLIRGKIKADKVILIFCGYPPKDAITVLTAFEPDGRDHAYAEYR